MLVADQSRIRNFAIIAHIDHGKSTLADRFIQLCGGLDAREMKAQVLDSMDLERERGITIKAQSVVLNYTAKDGCAYQLNLIDTPGHVDFSYEVSRSLQACEGALLVVDATQGVEAQTVANCCTAVDLGLTVIPVLNKIDLPAAQPESVMAEIEDVIGIDTADALSVSAKTGEGIESVLEQIVSRLPPPAGDPSRPLRALVLDSWFDNYLGVVSLIRVVDGRLRAGKTKVRMMSTGFDYQVERIGAFTPKAVTVPELSAGGGGVHGGRPQGGQVGPGRRYGYLEPRPGHRTAAGIPGNQAHRVRRPVSGQQRRLRGVPRLPRQTRSERCRAFI